MNADVVAGGLVFAFCRKCHQVGAVRVAHKGLTAESLEDFAKLCIQLAREHALLCRLAEGNVASEGDRSRVAQIEDCLCGLRCPCCDQPFLKLKGADRSA